MKHIGFTGTRHGMSDAQREATRTLMVRHATAVTNATNDFHWFGHHGDCVGADAQFHVICNDLDVCCVGHLPVDESRRAFCTFDSEAGDETRAPLKHMQRNRAIVAESDVMIACPLDMVEKAVGGTWKTVGFTRKAGKPLAIVWRDGTVTKERWP